MHTTILPKPPLPAGLALALCCALLTACGPDGKAVPRESGQWPEGRSPREVGGRVVETFLSNPFRIHKASGMIHYVETCTWQGALRFAKQTGDPALTERLVRRFDPLFGEQAHYISKPLNVDTTVFGSVPLELYMRTGDKRFLKIGLDLADAQWTTPADQSKLDDTAREAVTRGLSWHTRFWIDDMYMITMLQTQAYRATGDNKYLDRAALEAVAYLDKLQQPNGLFHHAPDAPFFWGRGNGWFAAGMSELLRALPAGHPNRARIMAGYQKMMATLLRHQDAEGKWHQLIDDSSSWQESSCTGMFTYAFATGVKHGWLDAATYGPAARKGWLALAGWINPDGAIRDVCEGTNALNDRNHYLNRGRVTGDLHGQAPVIWCANALME
ncbi:glycoside hydrolase family 88 protein [Termitidicoccus mucosus]|uniref:Glycosyl hydrolase n=1 Tax=Termitidicoccus mucosus TaxID=1184151 RepID=A0A178IDJ1_9BACT|nr:glycosyl hydrolase [Opitutaceae bacterium TSB47]